MAFTKTPLNKPIAMNDSGALSEKAQLILSAATDAINGKIKDEGNNGDKERKGRYTPKRRLSIGRKSRSKDRNAVKKEESASSNQNERSESPSDKPSESASDKPERYTPKRRLSIGRRTRSKDRTATKKAESNDDDDGESSNSLSDKARSTETPQSKDADTSKKVESDEEEKSTETTGSQPKERYTPRRRLSISRSRSKERPAKKKEESDEEQSATSKSTTKSKSRRRLKTTETSNTDKTKEEGSDDDKSASSKSERRKARKAGRRKKRASDIKDEYVIPKEPRPVSPERQSLIDSIDAEMTSIEEEIAALEKQFESDQIQFIEDVKVARTKGRAVQKKNMKGMEMMRVDILQQQGVDLIAVEEYLNEENKKLTARIQKEERDINNTRTNINKLVELNKQSDDAVRAATGAHRSLVVKREMNKELAKNAEMKVLSFEKSIFESNTQGEVEEQKKELTKEAIKKILRKVQAECTDELLTADVLQVASVALAQELGISDDDDDGDEDADSSESESSDSEDDKDDDDDHEGDDGSVSSVEVSLPDSYYDL